MKYLGSKNKIAKYILPIMLEYRNDRTWVEPFIGGANTIDKIDGKRIGNDRNEYASGNNIYKEKLTNTEKLFILKSDGGKRKEKEFNVVTSFGAGM